MYRIGNGIDFHRLELNENRPLILGAYIIESEYALVGHSDADIILHALADAILGALAMGDIGEHFPDTDPANKNLDSSIILKHALSIMKDKHYELENIDITVIAQIPRLSPHKNDIRNALAHLLNLSKDHISLKATTTEKMDDIGKGLGISCYAVVLLKKFLHKFQ
ncbi:MAG: 2-C-methyl-D-erythritol 2,4-cyclodiphosphate synthase [Leptospiraceae bacterium]|nr:2-C-methyl-D-erythritol 2,4-cyclodiphosphate synthase [Leptospiraceae bacterium]MCP5501210.1 2-C-methyl-D-erythritol 2,4-cyclodiphosphate synthase [Leptospiraceae bacterium]